MQPIMTIEHVNLNHMVAVAQDYRDAGYHIEGPNPIGDPIEGTVDSWEIEIYKRDSNAKKD